MKKSILLAVLLVGAGVATSKAGVAFGINIDNSRGYVSGNYTVAGCAQPSSGYVYSQPSYSYSYSGGVNYATDPCRDGQHQALHRELRREAAYGVPPWLRKEQHREGHRDLKWQHKFDHREMTQDRRDCH